MVNPNGYLSGYADPRDPNWRDNLTNAIRDPKRVRNKRTWDRIVNIEADSAYFDMIADAAKQRGITRAAYMRRAIAAFAAYDTGTPIEDILYHTTSSRPYHDGKQEARFHKQRDDGQGYGPWTIEGLS